MIFLGSERIELYNNIIYSDVSEKEELKDREESKFFVSDTMLISKTVKQAISDMKKDCIIQQYQYFVGNIATVDGVVTRTKKL